MASRPHTNDWSDEEILRALELRDRGLSLAEIGWEIRRSKDSVGGMLQRVDMATEASEHDGTMPARWWQEGLKRQRTRTLTMA